MNAMPIVRAPTTLRPYRTGFSQFFPFVAFFILLCVPADLSIGPVSLSLIIFPVVLLGYNQAARAAFNDIIPGAQELSLVILGTAVVFCAWGIITAIGASEFLRTFRPLYGHASGLAVVISILALSRTQENARKVRLYCMASLMFFMAMTYLIGPRAYNDRYPGTFKHPNQLGIVALMAALYFLALIVSTAGKTRLLSIFGCGIALLAIMLSGSKTNLLLFAILSPLEVAIVPFQSRNGRQALLELPRNIIYIIVVIVAGIAILPSLNERAFDVLDSVASGTQDVEQYHSVEDRNAIWRESSEMLKKYPLTGVGAGQTLSDGTEHSHNIFFDAGRTTGFPGLALISLFIAAVIWYVFAALRAGRMLVHNSISRMASSECRGPFVGSLMALIGYLGANQMSDSFGASTLPFFYMFFALSLVFFLPSDDHRWGEV